MPSLARRIDEPELMDDASLTAEELAATLEFLAGANRWLGGRAVVLGLLERWSRRWPKGGSVTLLDVGTGGADIPLAVRAWAESRGFDVAVTAIDASPAVAGLARRRVAARPGITVLEADLYEFARRGAAFDYVTASLFLHHVPDPRLGEALRALDSLAGRGLIVSDLERCRAGLLAVRLLTALFGDRVARHDGPLSVRRSFRPAELQALAREAGLGYLCARRHPFFRISLAGEKDVADSGRRLGLPGRPADPGAGP